MKTSHLPAKKNKKELSVAILSKDIKMAKDISVSLREFSILGHYYHDLDSFWVGIKDEMPELAIIDVEQMSQGELVLKNHPFVQDKILPMAFLYNDDSQFLLTSTHSLLHYGYINSDFDLKSQINQILVRREEDLRIREENLYLNERVNRLRLRNAQIIAENLDIKNMGTQQQQALGFVQQIEQLMTQKSFHAALSQVLDNWAGVIKYSFYELSMTKNKLIPHHFFSVKYIGLPELSLGQDQKNGIAPFAVDMAQQVARDVVGTELKVIKIKAKHDNPELLVFVEVNLEEQGNFSWAIFEILLSGLYARTKIIESRENKTTDEALNIWDFFDKLDDMKRNNLDNEYKVIHISFNKLLKTLKERNDNTFFWHSFYKEVSSELKKIVEPNGHFCSFGTKSLLAIVENKGSETKFLQMKTLMDKFPLYKYFEDSAIVVSKELTPTVRLITAGSVNALRHIDQDYNELDNAIEVASQRAAQIMSRTEV